MITHYRNGLLYATLALSLAACGSRSDNAAEQQPVETAVETPVDDSALAEAVASHDRAGISASITDMALNADDLSPRQAVTVLMGFYEMHLQYASEGRAKRDMEAMRNFVDVYDIVRSNHGKEFVSALADTRSVYPDADFEQVYLAFAERLSNYDGSGLSDSPAPADTAAAVPADTVAEDQLPPELRPAL